MPARAAHVDMHQTSQCNHLTTFARSGLDAHVARTTSTSSHDMVNRCKKFQCHDNRAKHMKGLEHCGKRQRKKKQSPTTPALKLRKLRNGIPMQKPAKITVSKISKQSRSLSRRFDRQCLFGPPGITDHRAWSMIVKSKT